MRAIILSAAVLVVLAFAGTTRAQGVFGTQTNVAASRMPVYARPNLSMSGTMTWGQKLWSIIPDFKGFNQRTGMTTSYPNPDSDPQGYIKSFGYRRLR